jgi:hypothetical protein
VQFAHGVRDNRAYAVKFFLDEDSFYAEAALYVAVFPSLKLWLSQRATEALERITALPEGDAIGGSEAAQTMQAAGARFLPQVHSSSLADPACYLCGIVSLRQCRVFQVLLYRDAFTCFVRHVAQDIGVARKLQPRT